MKVFLILLILLMFMGSIYASVDSGNIPIGELDFEKDERDFLKAALEENDSIIVIDGGEVTPKTSELDSGNTPIKGIVFDEYQKHFVEESVKELEREVELMIEYDMILYTKLNEYYELPETNYYDYIDIDDRTIHWHGKKYKIEKELLNVILEILESHG